MIIQFDNIAINFWNSKLKTQKFELKIKKYI